MFSERQKELVALAEQAKEWGCEVATEARVMVRLICPNGQIHVAEISDFGEPVYASDLRDVFAAEIRSGGDFAALQDAFCMAEGELVERIGALVKKMIALEEVVS